MAKSLKELLKLTLEPNVSDLHINVGTPAQIRLDGSLKSVDDDALSPDDTKSLCYEILTQEQIKKFELEKELDLAMELGTDSRFRVNLFYQKGNVSGAFRQISMDIPGPEELGLPSVIHELTKKPRGLVLVTGPTGSGKSTTLASMIEEINKTRHEHIITIEDPIEYIYKQKKSAISQREIGSDSKSFAHALKYILRQDPDVVLIGEMRDLETIRSAITTAETGHLVFATLHTNNATQTIDRIVDVFPPHQQPQIKTQLSFILEGVLSQQLLPKVGGGRVAAVEVMIPNTAIRNLIREGKSHQLYSQMMMGQDRSTMQTMNQALAKLAKNKIISREEATKRCFDLEEFLKMIK